VTEDKSCCPAAEEIVELRGKLTQLAADFSNHKKRSATQVAHDVAKEIGKLVVAFLPVLDALDEAVAHGIEGTRSARSILWSALAGAGMAEITPEGGKFDPTVAEAFVVAEGDDVLRVVRRGYLWRGTLLRAALVEVGTRETA